MRKELKSLPEPVSGVARKHHVISVITLFQGTHNGNALERTSDQFVTKANWSRCKFWWAITVRAKEDRCGAASASRTARAATLIATDHLGREAAPGKKHNFSRIFTQMYFWAQTIVFLTFKWKKRLAFCTTVLVFWFQQETGLRLCLHFSNWSRYIIDVADLAFGYHT